MLGEEAEGGPSSFYKGNDDTRSVMNSFAKGYERFKTYGDQDDRTFIKGQRV